MTAELRELSRRNPATVVRHEPAPARGHRSGGAARGISLVLLALTVLFFVMFLLALNS